MDDCQNTQSSFYHPRINELKAQERASRIVESIPESGRDHRFRASSFRCAASAQESAESPNLEFCNK
jgi:hypothetical protein